jgi:hypothetical protein
MSLKYILLDNKLTKDIEDDFVASPVDVKVRSYPDLEKDITGPGSILKPTESRAVVQNYWGGIAKILANGDGYRDEYITVKLNMSGSYIGSKDRFDRNRHSIVVSLQPGNLLKEAATKVVPEYVKAAVNVPYIETVYDWGSDTTNQKLTPGATLEIKGQDLKIYDHVDGQGVFFISQANGQETKAIRMRTNEPITLTLMVPQLSQGSYRIEIRNTTRQGKDLRVGAYYNAFEVS